MTTERFKEIRGKHNFLFLYYKEEGGVVPENQFSAILSAWVMRMGIMPMHGLAQITNWLDEKYKK